MSSIKDPIKQEENVKTGTLNDHFITDVRAHIHTLVHVQHEAFHATETLQQLQPEVRELHQNW